MARFNNVDDYIAAQEPANANALAAVRAAITKALGKRAEETITYDMPTYKIRGAVVIYFAAWKKHLAVYPASPRVQDAFAADLASYEVEKSTIRMPWASLSPPLIAAIAKFRAIEAS